MITSNIRSGLGPCTKPNLANVNIRPFAEVMPLIEKDVRGRKLEGVTFTASCAVFEFSGASVKFDFPGETVLGVEATVRGERQSVSTVISVGNPVSDLTRAGSVAIEPVLLRGNRIEVRFDNGGPLNQLSLEYVPNTSETCMAAVAGSADKNFDHIRIPTGMRPTQITFSNMDQTFVFRERHDI